MGGRPSVSKLAAQSEVLGQKSEVLQKIRAVTKKNTCPIALKRIEHGLTILDSKFYSFQSDRMKNKKVLVFVTALFSR